MRCYMFLKVGSGENSTIVFLGIKRYCVSSFGETLLGYLSNKNMNKEYIITNNTKPVSDKE